MIYGYEKLYASTQSALGEPTRQLVEFFEPRQEPKLRVLDIGCGQGRDALFIARMGHEVVGVDLSESGVRDLNDAASQEQLSITAFAADITDFVPDGVFDLLLFDRTLHMLPTPQRHQLLDRLLDYVSARGWVLIADERSNLAGLKDVFQKHKSDWDIYFEKRGFLFTRGI